MVSLAHMPDMDSLDFLASGEGEQKKLAILGLPWETTEETLKAYFSQFGALDHAEIMRDRYTGKSRGFGFVTFMDPAAASRALSAEHTIDGRRCEAKVALPKGEPSPPRTTRIFVARIPPSVTESQFRSYFEAFGKLQDAYMPKDHSKQGYRGIGFVTFASPDSVEKVMAVKHWMNGHEIAIDRATPKEEPAAAGVRTMFARLPLEGGQRRSFDNGAGIIGPGLTSVMNLPNGLITPSSMDAAFSNLRSLSEDRELNNIVQRAGIDVAELQAQAQNPLGAGTPMNSFNEGNGKNAMSQSAALRASQALGMNLGMNLHQSNSAAAAAAAATTAALQTLAKAQSNLSDSASLAFGSMQLGSNGVHNFPADISASIISNALNKAAGMSSMQDVNTAAAVQQLMAAAAVQQGRRSLDAAMSHIKRAENPAIANARAGPRLFIGKLTKDTTEADVKEYFMRYGYVMDVYLPKSKDNKAEHRGFGFVTFETEAAIQRVVSHGTHRLKGSTIAIDIAMPKVEEGGELGLDSGLDGTPSLQAFQNLPSLMVQRI